MSRDLHRPMRGQDSYLRLLDNNLLHALDLVRRSHNHCGGNLGEEITLIIENFMCLNFA